jgi:hypothetical protein
MEMMSWIGHFIVMYVVNTIFVFTFTFLFGEFAEVGIPKLIASSIFYVLPYTLINFVITGFATCYLIRIIVENKKNIAALLLLLITGIDVWLFVQFFNNGELLIVLIRAGFVWVSFIATYLLVRRKSRQ